MHNLEEVHDGPRFYPGKDRKLALRDLRLINKGLGIPEEAKKRLAGILRSSYGEHGLSEKQVKAIERVYGDLFKFTEKEEPADKQLDMFKDRKDTQGSLFELVLRDILKEFTGDLKFLIKFFNQFDDEKPDSEYSFTVDQPQDLEELVKRVAGVAKERGYRYTEIYMNGDQIAYVYRDKLYPKDREIKEAVGKAFTGAALAAIIGLSNPAFAQDSQQKTSISVSSAHTFKDIIDMKEKLSGKIDDFSKYFNRVQPLPVKINGKMYDAYFGMSKDMQKAVMKSGILAKRDQNRTKHDNLVVVRTKNGDYVAIKVFRD